MNERVLIPTDFKTSSLGILKHVLAENQGKNLDVVLVFDCDLKDSITDLLFISKKDIINSQCNQDFRDGLTILQNRFQEGLSSVRIEPFFGYNKSAFRSFIKANGITSSYVPEDYKNKSYSSMLRNMCAQIVKGDVKTRFIALEVKQNIEQQNSILNLFNA
jgi:hypothetical protein